MVADSPHCLPPKPPRSARPHRSASDVQVGGDHYRDMKIQPAEFIHANGIGWLEGTAIEYLSRWRKKGGIRDLEKARHAIEILIELETKGSR